MLLRNLNYEDVKTKIGEENSDTVIRDPTLSKIMRLTFTAKGFVHGSRE